MSTSKYDYSFKFLIIGDSDVGKQSFILSFTGDSFTATHLEKIGIDFKIKTIKYENKLVKLQIWDTAGEERFRTITSTYYKGFHGIILMYDVTDHNSFKSIRNWIKHIEANADKSVKKVLVGHKCNAFNRVIIEEEGQNLADEYNIGFFESSAKINKNVSEVFYYLVKEIFIEKGIIKDKSEVEKRKEKKRREKEEKQAKKNLNYLIKYINF